LRVGASRSIPARSSSPSEVSTDGGVGSCQQDDTRRSRNSLRWISQPKIEQRLPHLGGQVAVQLEAAAGRAVDDPLELDLLAEHVPQGRRI
jgi:hypothetical protein